MLPDALVAEEPVNHCHKPEVEAQWQQLLADSPEDAVVIRLYALRDGLCHMVDEGLVDLEQAIDIFNREHARSVMGQVKEDNEKPWDLALWQSATGADCADRPARRLSRTLHD